MQSTALVKYPHTELPPLETDQSRLVLAAGGLYRERSSSMFVTSTRLQQRNLGLEEHHQYCRLLCGRLPRVMHGAMLAFFKSAHELHGGEAALVLLYHPQQRRFRWHCPIQTVNMFWSFDRWVSGDSIEFENPLVMPRGYVHFGDAHLHPGPPIPSAIDLHDDQDGLHIIVGNINTSPSYNVDFVVDDVRFRVAPRLIFDDADCPPMSRAPESWLRQIRIRHGDTYARGDTQRSNGWKSKKN